MGIMRKITGRKVKDYMEIEGPISSEKERIVYPKLYLELENLPEARDYKIGKDYDVTLKLKLCNMNLYRKLDSDDECGSVEFEIIGIETHGESKKQKKFYPRSVNKK